MVSNDWPGNFVLWWFTLMHLEHALIYAYNRAYKQNDLRAIGMRTTLNINDDLLKRAQELTGVTEKTAIVKMGIEALIARESAKRLAKLGGSDPTLKEIPRRRG